MRKVLGALVTASVMAGAFALAAQSASLPTINDSMTKIMSVNAQTIWDISSKAFNKRGDGLLSSKITAKDWAQLSEASKAIRARALLLAESPTNLVVKGRDEHILGEEFSPGGAKRTYDAANAAQIKSLISANPKLFAKKAMTLADAMESLTKASARRDVKGLYKVSSDLDELCDGCHEPFWGTDEPPTVSLQVARKLFSPKR